jgi:hypothetical protein
MAESIEDLKARIIVLEALAKKVKDENEILNSLVSAYEQNGPAKLFYSLNRKANEMADLLNKTNLSSIVLDDPKDKTFERMKIVWNDASSITSAVTALEISAGITGDEEKDVKTKKYITTPESIANQLGDNKAQDV